MRARRQRRHRRLVPWPSAATTCSGRTLTRCSSAALQDRRYTPEQTACWLSWLAYKMANHGQTVFYLEQLQRDWLPQKQQWAVKVSTLVISGLICSLVGGPLAGLLWGLLGGLLLSVIWLTSGVFLRGAVEFVYLRNALAVGLVVGLLVGLVRGLVSLSKEIVCAETVRWSWSRCRRRGSSMLVVGLVIGLLCTPVVLLVDWLLGEMFDELLLELILGLFLALMLGLALGLFGGLLGGLTYGQINAKAVPNEGIRRSARNALFVGLIGVFFGGLFVGILVGLVDLVGSVVVGLGDWLETALGVGLFAGVSGGLVGWLLGASVWR